MQSSPPKTKLASISNFTIAFGAAFFIVALACDDGDTSNGDDAGTQNTDDSGTPPREDSGTPSELSSCWKSAAGKYTATPAGCGIGTIEITVGSDSVTATPFGENASATFKGPGDELNASGLKILGKDAHDCKVSCLSGPKPSIQIACTNAQGGSCSEGVTHD